MNTHSNPQIELAFSYVCHTNKHIFLTGKAGTGKTTFLHRIRSETIKRMAVVAPTGVAAINARGVTIHSLFQLPFGPLVPELIREDGKRRRFSSKKINLLKCLDLLIIDEISMVRADVLDAIDEVLRRYRDFSQPFGGVQLLMIGDLHQLPPVVKSEEWQLLQPYYDTAYFFGSLALQKTDAVVIELKHIYRQSDSKFINLLNRVRDNRIDSEALNTLNSRYRSDFNPTDEDGYITLSSHNHSARKINADKLTSISGKLYHFKATIEGEFPENSYPNELELEFKKDAQVMFVKNDLSEDKLYYNGKIGTISKIKDDDIYVRCPGEGEDITVTQVEWQNTRYSLDERSKKVEEEVIGTFTQYPLKLAWAITIHKSQGLTFDKLIIDAAASFAHGQVYVALSRCRTFEGIVLRSFINASSVLTDSVVRHYTEEAQQNEPTESNLRLAKHEFQQSLLRGLFDFKNLKNCFDRLRRAILENENSLQGNVQDELTALNLKAKEGVTSLAEKFMPQLEAYLQDSKLPVDNEELRGRLRGASAHFSKQLKGELLNRIKAMQILTDNKAVKKQVNARLDDLKKELIVKNACFESCLGRFDPQAFIHARNNAEIDFKKTQTSSLVSVKSPKDIAHPELYKLLTQWRAETADLRDIEHYAIAPTRTLIEIAEVLPTKAENLKRIHGIGKQRVENFGKDLIQIITQYSQENNIETDQLQFASGRGPKTPRASKGESQAITLKMFQDGKSRAEIAKERNLAVSTIESHLSHGIGMGQLDVFSLMNKEKAEAGLKYFEKAENQSLKEARDHLGESYSYGELHMILAHFNYCKEKG